MKYQLGLVVNSSLAHNSILLLKWYILHFSKGGGGRVNIGPSERTTTLQNLYELAHLGKPWPTYLQRLAPLCQLCLEGDKRFPLLRPHPPAFPPVVWICLPSWLGPCTLLRSSPCRGEAGRVKRKRAACTFLPGFCLMLSRSLIRSKA